MGCGLGMNGGCSIVGGTEISGNLFMHDGSGSMLPDIFL